MAGSSSKPCLIDVEDSFGPIVAESCLRGFDFTLLFEEGILTIVPLGIAVFWALLRLIQLRNEVAKVYKSWSLWLKMLFFVAYVSLQTALLAIWIAHQIPKTRLTVACISLTMAAYSILLIVSYLEHIRSVRPSTLLSVFLGFSTLLDLARVRTLFFLLESKIVPSVFLASFLVKILMLSMELMEKRSLLLPGWKDASPEETSSSYNRALFIWLNNVFFRGFQSLLTVDILTPLDAELHSASKPITLAERWERADKSSENALLWIFLVHYKWAVLAGVLPRLANTGFLFAQPFLVERVLDFVAEPAGVNTTDTAYGLIGAYAIVYIGIALSYAVYEHKTYRLLTMCRGSLITLIFSKTLRIGSAAIADAEAITLMSADIDRLGVSLPLLHEVYASVIEIGVALWLLYRLLGVAMVAPILWIVLCLVIGLPIATAAGNAQIPWLEAIEDRLALTAKALGAMKAIKMTGLAETVSARIVQLRQSEIRASLRYRILNILVTISYYASSALAPVWGYGVYMLLAKARNTQTLTEGIAFAALSLFELMNQPLIHVVDGVEHIQTVLNSFGRIQEYLLSEEREDHRITPATNSNSIDTLLSDSKEKDDSSLEEPLLSELEQSNLAAAVKDVSASYSAEGQCILKNLSFDIPHSQTTMIVGPVGSGKSTLLKLLLGEMPNISGTVIANFSKAAFCAQSPWITWGTIRSNITGMSAWDKTWYDTVIRACSLSTDFEDLPRGDLTNTGTRGSRLSGGQQMRVSLARALYSRNPVMILDYVLTGLDRTTERNILDAVFGPTGLIRRQLNSTVILATNSASHLHFADNIIVLNEDGQIAQQGTLEALSASSDYIEKLAGQPPVKTYRPELEISDETLQEIGIPFDDPEPETSRQTGDIKVYGYYANIAGWWSMLLYILACAAFIFGESFPSVWLQWWTNANAERPNEDIGYWLGIYGALGGITLLGCMMADFVFRLIVVPRTSKRFHELLLTTTMKAPTSLLTSTDAGTTLNRFSQDLELIDNDLPKSLDQTAFEFLSSIMSAVLIFIGSGYLAAAIPVCIFFLALIQLYYLRTSRQLRLLDIEAKAPLFSQFLETLGGIPCIRAYGWTHDYMERNFSVLNTSQKPYYLMWCIQRWLTLVLDLFVAGVAILLVALATNIRSGQTGFLGVALFNIVTFSTTLQMLVTEWTQVETALGAINRIRKYVTTTKDENLPSETGSVLESWPQSGAITFKKVSASYDSSLEPVLRQISFSISPGEKVAICGRTGSGKSSTISALLRMLELQSGTISIDGIDIVTIPRQEVRSRLTTLPQEPFFLHGSVRENIDPEESASDERIEEALRAVRMWDFFQEREGLNADMNEETLSHGQRQLFCLARAILKPGSILIMDEATSNVDPDTDELMQRVLREESRGRTIIAIVHKLHTILDFDRVILLDKGRIAEIGNPKELLETPSSAFRALYESHQGEGQCM